MISRGVISHPFLQHVFGSEIGERQTHRHAEGGGSDDGEYKEHDDEERG